MSAGGRWAGRVNRHARRLQGGRAGQSRRAVAGRLDPTPAAPRIGRPRQLTTVVRTRRLRLFAGPSSPRQRARAGSGNWDLPHSHHEAAGEGARQWWGLVTAKAESERRARLRHRFPNLKRLLKASVKMRRCARGREAIHTTCPTRHTTRHTLWRWSLPSPGQASEDRDTPGGAGGSVPAPKTPLPGAPALAARTYPTPPTRDTSVRTTQTHCNTQPGSEVPVQAARTACAPGREAGVAGGAHRNTPQGTATRREEGSVWEGPSPNTRLRFLRALHLIYGNAISRVSSCV